MLSIRVKQQGIGLIEVLVSLLLLGVGLLGALSLQSTSLSAGQRASFALEAQIAASDMAARILAFSNTDPAADDLDIYDDIDTNTNDYADPGCNSCNQAETLQLDQFEWDQLIENADPDNNISLPSGQGQVTWEAATRTYTITVRYDRDRTGADGTDCDSNDKSDEGNLTCFIMEVRI